MKTIHRVYFPVFSLLETSTPAAGDRCVGHRKLLYLEKLFAAILLAAPAVRLLIRSRIQGLESGRENMAASLRTRLKIVKGLQILLDYWLPAAFRIGYLVRSCCWEGRQQGSCDLAHSATGQCLLLMIQLIGSKAANDPYCRTLSCAMLFWQPWHSLLPRVCFVEESNEAMLLRFSHRLDVNRHITSFDDTFVHQGTNIAIL